jgi:hypothetical protein
MVGDVEVDEGTGPEDSVLELVAARRTHAMCSSDCRSQL